MKKIIFGLFLFVALISLSLLTPAKAESSFTISMEDGASIRTTDPAGIMFKGVVTGEVLGTNVKYGIAFANGEVEASKITVGATGVVSAEVSELNEDGTFAVSMVRIPSRAYVEEMTARAYVNIDGEYTYSENVVTRNIYEIAKKLKDEGNSNEFIESIVTNCFEITYNTNGGNLVWASHAEMVDDFISDIKDVLGKTVTASTIYSGVSNNFHTFFADEEMFAKWSWALQLFHDLGEAGYGKHEESQAQYEAFLAGNGSTISIQWALRQSFQALMTLGKCGSYSGTACPNFGLYEVSSQIEGAINGGLAHEIIGKEGSLETNVYRKGYEFAGWYADSMLTSKVDVVSMAQTVYAKWDLVPYAINYELDGGVLPETYASSYYITEGLSTYPTPTRDGYIFDGWYEDEAFTKEASAIAVGSASEVTVYAKWIDASSLSVTYNFDGGNSKYATREELIADYIKDYNASMGKSLATDGSNISTDIWADYSNAWTAFAIKDNQGDKKWTWLCEYLSTLAKDSNTGAGTSVKTNFPAILTATVETPDSNGYAGGYQYRAFLTATQYRPTSSSWASSNFTKEEYNNGFWEELSAAEQTKYFVATGSKVIENVYKPGYIFEGWYDTNGNKVDTITSTVTLTAKWKLDNEITVNYDFNGGYSTDGEIIKNNISGAASQTMSIVRYTGSYYTYHTEGILICDISSMTASSNTKFAHCIGVKKVDGVYQIVQIVKSGDTTAYTEDVEYVIYTSEGTSNIDTVISGVSVGDIIFFNQDPSTLSAGQVSLTASVYTKDQYLAARQKGYSVSVGSPYEPLCEVKHSSLTFVGWYDNAECTGEKLTTITKSMTVYAKWSSYIDASYETVPYAEVGSTIKVNAKVVGDLVGTLVWESKDPSIATVDQNGVITGVKVGSVDICVYDSGNPSVNLTITISVVSEGLSELFGIISGAHEDTVFTRDNLCIGVGDTAYNADIFGSVSKILYNNPLVIDTKYLANGVAAGNYYENSVKNEGLEFITVHYTGNMASGADTDNNASYFTTASAGVSIHYVTGNPGKYSDGTTSSSVYQCMDHAHGAWHAGDSNSRYYSNSTKTNSAGELIFTWIPTGVAYDDCDLLDVEWSVSNDFYFEINGVKTSIKLPTTWNFKSRNTNHIYNSNGTITSQSTYTGTTFSNRTPESFFNDQGFPIKVINGEYYMGPTWWNYSQVHEGRICSVGGNRSSIGIESCVNEGSDLWFTWQKTAQLVAKLLYDNGLGLERVKGHHFFDGKDCPQPLLENDMEIWYEFIELVRYEYELLSKFANYTISFTSHNPEYVDNTGRVILVPTKDAKVSYTVTLTDKATGVSQSVTYFTVIPGSGE